MITEGDLILFWDFQIQALKTGVLLGNVPLTLFLHRIVKFFLFLQALRTWKQTAYSTELGFHPFVMQLLLHFLKNAIITYLRTSFPRQYTNSNKATIKRK